MEVANTMGLMKLMNRKSKMKHRGLTSMMLSGKRKHGIIVGRTIHRHKTRFRRGTKPRMLITVHYQTSVKGSSRPKDKQRHALHSGKRKSKTGKIYWETRVNRSDRGKYY
jgi:hypothetical protein